MLVVCLEACAVVGIEVWLTVLSRVFGVCVFGNEGCVGGCLGRARAVWWLVFLCESARVMNGVKTSFYRQREKANPLSNRKEYSKDNAISIWYLIQIQSL